MSSGDDKTPKDSPKENEEKKEEKQEEEQGETKQEKKEPTVRKILEAEPPTEKELACMEYLKANVKGKLLDDDTYFLNETTYLRFARARDGKNEKALKMLESCIAWRREYKPHQVTKEDNAGFIRFGTVWRQGVCKLGNPILYIAPGPKNPYPSFNRVQFVIWLLEEAIRDGYDQLTWVFDWTWFGSRGKDEESTKTREKLQQVLQDYYPEFLGKLLFVDVPWYFSMLYAVASLFMTKRTTAKIWRIKGKQVKDHIDGDQLIKMYPEGELENSVPRLPDAEYPETYPDSEKVAEFRTWTKVEQTKPDESE